MSERLHHEQIYRGGAAMKKLAAASLTICGAGALGGNLAVNLVRQGLTRLTVIDDDRVEARNVGTQVYAMDDAGGLKAELLKNLIYRDLAEEIAVVTKRLTDKNAGKLLAGSDLIFDGFDNAASRKAVTDWCLAGNVPCLHAGLNDKYGEVRWNENYIVPSGAGEDVCDYPLARNLVLLVTSLASESIVRYFLDGTKLNLSVTFGDLKVHHD